MTTHDLNATCYLAVLRALELACRRRKMPDRNSRIAIPGIPAWQTHMHVRLAQDPREVPRLIDGAFSLLTLALVMHDCPPGRVLLVVGAVEGYTTRLILTQTEPKPDDLRAWIASVDIDA